MSTIYNVGLLGGGTGGGGGAVTSVNVAGGTTGLSFSGGPITTSGTITAAGTLVPANGGTGLTTYVTGDIIYASAANTLSALPVSTNGFVLTLSGGLPVWASGATALAIGNSVGSGTVGSVLFVGAGTTLQQDNTNFFWDDTSNILKLPVLNNKAGTSLTVGTSDAQLLSFTTVGTSRMQIAGTGTPGQVIIGDTFGVISGSTDQLVISSSTSPALAFARSGTAVAKFGVSDSAGGIVNGSLAGDFTYRADSGNTLFSTNGGTSTVMYFVSSGGAVGIGSFTGASQPAVMLHAKTTSAATTAIQRWQNTVDSVDFFVTNATPEGAITGSIGDLAIDGTGGNLYIKATGTATNTGWALNATSANAFVQGGNSFGTAATLGTNDANTLSLETGGTTRFTISASLPTITSTGNALYITDTGSAATFQTQDSGTATFDSGTTGNVNVGTGLNNKSVVVGNISATSALQLKYGAGNLTVDGLAASTISMGASAVTGTISIGGTGQTGAINLGTGTAGQPIHIGDGAAANVITIGSITGAASIAEKVGTGNYTLDGVGASTYAFGASTVAGTITVGGTAQTGTITLGSSSATSTVAVAAGAGASTVLIANGTGGNTVTIANGAGANIVTIGSTTGASSLTERVGTGNYSLDGVASSTYTVGASTTTGTISIGGTAQTGTITIGPSTASTGTLNLLNGNTAKTVNIAGGIDGNTVNVEVGANTTAQTLNLQTGANAANTVVNLQTGIASAGTQTFNVQTAANTQASVVNISTGPSGANKTVNIGNGTPTAGLTLVSIGTTSNFGRVDIQGAETRTVLSVGATGAVAAGTRYEMVTGTFTRSLPAPTGSGRIISIKNISAAATVSVDVTGGSLIDAGTGFSVATVNIENKNRRNQFSPDCLVFSFI